MNVSRPEDPTEAEPDVAPRHLGWMLCAWWVPAIVGLAYLGESRAGVAPVLSVPAGVERSAVAESSASITVCVHPSCSCTSRTLDLLAAIVDRRPSVDVSVLLTVPRDEGGAPLPFADDDPTRGGRFALRYDPGGSRARALGAERSGHAVLSDASGRVVFSGGVVSGGARCGANSDAVRAALTELDEALASSGEPMTAPVDGCPLVLEGDGAR